MRHIIFCKNISCSQLNLASYIVMNNKPQQKVSGKNLTNRTGGAAPEFKRILQWQLCNLLICIRDLVLGAYPWHS